jgi:hypothetical protein
MKIKQNNLPKACTIANQLMKETVAGDGVNVLKEEWNNQYQHLPASTKPPPQHTNMFDCSTP